MKRTGTYIFRDWLRLGLSVAAMLFLFQGCAKSAGQEARAMTQASPAVGKMLIEQYGCGSCHTIPGVRHAYALAGPPLTHMARRMYVAGVILNTPDHLMAWIKNPPAVDPMTAMPNLHMTDDDARAIAAYLYTLK